MGRLRSLSKADCARPKVFDAERSYFTAALQKGVDGPGASRSGDDNLKRFDSYGSFATGDLWFARYQTLSEHRRRPVPAYRQRKCRLHAR